MPLRAEKWKPDKSVPWGYNPQGSSLMESPLKWIGTMPRETSSGEIHNCVLVAERRAINQCQSTHSPYRSSHYGFSGTTAGEGLNRTDTLESSCQSKWTRLAYLDFLQSSFNGNYNERPGGFSERLKCIEVQLKSMGLRCATYFNRTQGPFHSLNCLQEKDFPIPCGDNESRPSRNGFLHYSIFLRHLVLNSLLIAPLFLTFFWQDSYAFNKGRASLTTSPTVSWITHTRRLNSALPIYTREAAAAILLKVRKITPALKKYGRSTGKYHCNASE